VAIILEAVWPPVVAAAAAPAGRPAGRPVAPLRAGQCVRACARYGEG